MNDTFAPQHNSPSHQPEDGTATVNTCAADATLPGLRTSGDNLAGPTPDDLAAAEVAAAIASTNADGTATATTSAGPATEATAGSLGGAPVHSPDETPDPEAANAATATAPTGPTAAEEPASLETTDETDPTTASEAAPTAVPTTGPTTAGEAPSPQDSDEPAPTAAPTSDPTAASEAATPEDAPAPGLNADPALAEGIIGGVVLTGRTAVVTGASGNIGAEIAVLLAQLGAHVIVADLPGQPTDVTVERIQAFGGTAEVWDVDLRDHELLANVHLECDILVNSAGSSVIASIEEFDPVDWDRIIDVMLTAPFLLTRAALPHMYKQKWGRIINISGVNGLRGSEGRVAYAAAKHGLEGLTKVTALEAGQHNVTANCVNPGFARTAHTRKLIKQEAQRHWLPEDEVVDKVILRRNAIKDMAEPQEIAAQVAWLCSDYARLITGTNIVVDGGVSAS